MILCLIILIISVLMVVAGAIILRKTFGRWDLDPLEILAMFLVLIGAAAFLTVVIIMPVESIGCKKELNVFVCQKEYIENYTSDSEYDTAAIVSKKAELNQWLYEVQYTKEHYPICSFYGDEILELEPIK